MYGGYRKLSIFKGLSIQIDAYTKDADGTTQYMLENLTGFGQPNIERPEHPEIDGSGTFISKYGKLSGNEISITILAKMDTRLALENLKHVLTYNAPIENNRVQFTLTLYSYDNTDTETRNYTYTTALTNGQFLTEWEEISDANNHVRFTINFKTREAYPTATISGA